jgi:hypothetical protein
MSKNKPMKEAKKILDKLWSVTLENEGSLSAKVTELTYENKSDRKILLLTPANCWIEGKLGEFGKFEILKAMYSHKSQFKSGRGHKNG